MPKNTGAFWIASRRNRNRRVCLPTSPRPRPKRSELLFPRNPLPSRFLAARQDGLAHIISFAKLMPKPGGAVSCTSLDSPSDIWEVVYETSEKCDAMIIVTSMG